MQATLQRRTVIGQLQDAPWRFDFFQAVRLLVEWLGQQGIPPDQALVDHVWFENCLSFASAPSQIAALDASDPLHIHLTPAFMGFLGAHGTLPQHYTERIAAHQSATKDDAPRAFFDMFSNRALAQFYTAWRKHRVEHAGRDGADGFLPLLLSLAGMRAGATAIDDATIAKFAGATLQRPVPPDILRGILGDYLGLPLAIDETVGAWIHLHEHERCALGGINAALGHTTLLGKRSWRPDLHAQLRIGPLDRAAFDSLLPDGARAQALAQLLRLFGNPTLTYVVRLVLKAAEINPLCLSGHLARLGQDTFLVGATETRDRGDMCYRLAPLAPLPPLPAPRPARSPPGLRPHRGTLS